jgi:hypothetical protein
VSGLRLRKTTVRLLLRGVDQVGKLDRILNEKHRDVVADDVPVAFPGIKLHRETPHVAREIRRSFIAGDGREPHECGCLFPGPLEQIGAGRVGQRLVVFEIAMSAESAGMNYTLRNSFMIEMKDLFPKVEVLERGRPASANFQGILIVRNRYPLLSGQHWNIAIRGLMNLTAGA